MESNPNRAFSRLPPRLRVGVALIGTAMASEEPGERAAPYGPTEWALRIGDELARLAFYVSLQVQLDAAGEPPSVARSEAAAKAIAGALTRVAVSAIRTSAALDLPDATADSAEGQGALTAFVAYLADVYDSDPQEPNPQLFEDPASHPLLLRDLVQGSGAAQGLVLLLAADERGDSGATAALEAAGGGRDGATELLRGQLHELVRGAVTWVMGLNVDLAKIDVWDDPGPAVR